MPAPGFPSQDPLKNKGGANSPVRSPVQQGSLMDWLRWNFPTTYAAARKVVRDSNTDYKSADYAKQHPGNSGRVP